MSHLQQLESKLMDALQLTEQLKKWRDQGCKIYFTHCRFALFHLGHVAYFSPAADSRDNTIIALNTDRSLSRLKGPSTPINDERSSALVLAALSCVSAVILFDEPTPLELIRLVNPDVLVKGADYKIENIVGADVVIARGGSVKTIPFVEGYSTTAIEQRIRQAKI